MKKAKDIDEYIAGFPDDTKKKEKARFSFRLKNHCHQA